MRDRERDRNIGRGEPDVGLDSRTRGSQPEPKAATQPLSHPGALLILKLRKCYSENHE